MDFRNSSVVQGNIPISNMKKILFFLIFIGLIIGSIYAYWTYNIAPVNKFDKSNKIFVVAKGEGVKSIGNNLEKEGLIRNGFTFFLLVKQLGIENKIQAGDFRLSPSQSAEEIAKNLTHGTLDIWVTIPEGRRAEEIADILEQEIPKYTDDWRTELVKHEGYLFPDTYLIPRDADIDFVVSLLKNTFEKKYASLDKGKNKLPKQDVVILASLIEREARHDEDRPLVASVLLNRLDIDMALQIDATVQYALGYQRSESRWWKRHLTLDDLKIRSPYNTYTTPGLPPTPIANPGLKALQAVLTPAETDYLYYITDKNGVNRYAKTNTEHERNIQKYGL